MKYLKLSCVFPKSHFSGDRQREMGQKRNMKGRR